MDIATWEWTVATILREEVPDAFRLEVGVYESARNLASVETRLVLRLSRQGWTLTDEVPFSPSDPGPSVEHARQTLRRMVASACENPYVGDAR